MPRETAGEPAQVMMLTVAVLLSLTDALFLIQWCSAGLAGPAIRSL